MLFMLIITIKISEIVSEKRKKYCLYRDLLLRIFNLTYINI